MKHEKTEDTRGAFGLWSQGTQIVKIGFKKIA